MNLWRAMFLASLIGCGAFGCAHDPSSPPPTSQKSQDISITFRCYALTPDELPVAEFTISNATARSFWFLEKNGWLSPIQYDTQLWQTGRWINVEVGPVCTVGMLFPEKELPAHKATRLKFSIDDEGTKFVRFGVPLTDRIGTNDGWKNYWSENVPPPPKDLDLLKSDSTKP